MPGPAAYPGGGVTMDTRGMIHKVCGPYRAIRETLTGRRIVECETCGAICIVGRPYEEVRRRKGVYADTYI